MAMKSQGWKNVKDNKMTNNIILFDVVQRIFDQKAFDVLNGLGFDSYCETFTRMPSPTFVPQPKLGYTYVAEWRDFEDMDDTAVESQEKAYQIAREQMSGAMVDLMMRLEEVSVKNE
jgi:hypothetical protein